MCPRVGFLEGFDRHLGVNLGRVEPGVAEQLLDQADVRPVLQHVRGAAVPEQMTTAALADVGRLHRPGHPVADVGRAHALAVANAALSLAPGP